jgi:hypothetical protein
MVLLECRPATGNWMACAVRATPRETMMTATLTRDETRARRPDTSEAVEVLSREAFDELVERETRRLTGHSAHEAFEMLDRGELHGTAAAGALRTLRHLLWAA